MAQQAGTEVGALRAREPIVIHYVHDMRRAIRFYREVFGAGISFESPGWSTLDFGPIELALHILAPGHDDEAPIPHAGVNFLVDDIETLQVEMERLGGRITEIREATDFVPVRVATCFDSEGNGFELRQVPH